MSKRAFTVQNSSFTKAFISFSLSTIRYNADNEGNTADTEETGEICEKCGKPMIIKAGRYGKFLSCSGYPECKNIKPIPVKLNKSKIPCPTGCGGYLVEKRTKKGRRFFGCSSYPKCDYAAWTLQPEKAK